MLLKVVAISFWTGVVTCSLDNNGQTVQKDCCTLFFSFFLKASQSSQFSVLWYLSRCPINKSCRFQIRRMYGELNFIILPSVLANSNLGKFACLGSSVAVHHLEWKIHHFPRSACMTNKMDMHCMSRYAWPVKVPSKKNGSTKPLADTPH